MKKILIILSVFCHILAYGQSPNGISNSLTETNAHFIKKGNLTVFINPVSSKKDVSDIASRTKTTDSQQAGGLVTTFNVNMGKAGKYFFLANTLSTYINHNEFQKIKVFVNGVYQGILHNTKADWEVIGIENKQSILLEQGDNKIEFVTEPPFYPEIDAIQLSEDAEAMIKENAPYMAYKQRLAAHAPIAEPQPQPTEPWQVSPKQIAIYGNPNGTAYQNVPVVYTYNRKITLQSAERVVINTTPVSGDDFRDVDTYMYLYKTDDPQHYSYSNDNYQGLHSKIDVKLPAGEYYLVIRSKYNNFASQYVPRAGLVNVYYNDAILNESVAVSGYMIDVPSVAGTINYFTSKTESSPLLFILNGDKMMFNTTPYRYYPPADYTWLEGARIKLNIPKRNDNMKMLVTCVGAWWINYGHADVYGGFQDAPDKYMKEFPNLKSGDAILMAGDDSKYNSAAWAGGITDRNIYFPYFPKFGGLVWWTAEDYFGNNPKRYEGAVTYTKNGSGERAVIEYTQSNVAADRHLYSVTNNANNTLHGFAYESKIGEWGRITHEYKSLTGTEKYGDINCCYYEQLSTPTIRPENTDISGETYGVKPVYTLAESLKDGLSVVKDEKLTEEQKKVIKASLSRSVCGFARLYADWENKIIAAKKEKADTQDDLFNSSEWLAAIEYGKKNTKESLMYLAEILFCDQDTAVIDKEAVSILFCSIAAEKYNKLMQNIYDDWSNNSYTDDGAYICPSYEYFTKLYIKAIIQREWMTDGNAISKPEKNDGEIGNNPNLCSVSENIIGVNGTDLKLCLPCDATISLQIVNNSRVVDVVRKASYAAGEYNFHINPSDLLAGVNICVLKINDRAIRRKIIKR